MTLVIFILILIALVWVHELGHFVAAKILGIRVDEFAIGFPPRLVSIKIGETEYSLNWLLFGGYVSIHGEDPSAHSSDPRGLSAKPRPLQALVVVAGIAMNLLFAWLLLSAGYMHGLQSEVDHYGWGNVSNAQPEVIDVLPGSPADKAGIESGDVVVSAETGAKDMLPANADADQVHDFLTAHAGASIALVVDRDGAQKDFIVKAQAGVVAGQEVIGVELDDVGILKLSPGLALLQGGLVAKEMIVAEAQGLGSLVAGIVHGAPDFSQVSGPIGIASAGSQAVAQGFDAIITITALISINLALINIIPIPGLDGGRLLFIIVESIIRRPISPRVATALTLAGFAFVILLMIAVSAHDIAKLVG